MGNLQVFQNEQFGKIRTVLLNNEPWFVGKDVVGNLGYQNGSRDINRHVDEEDRQNYRNGTFESPRGLTIINESGLYSLILSSKLPQAKAFKRWITHDVLPAIRKTGQYQLHQSAPVSSSPHEVVTKMYDDRYVLTIADIARLTGVSGGLICYFIRGKLPSPLRINIDYFFLEGMLTRAYKQQNALVPKSTSVLIVVTKSGFVKICKQFNIGNALRLFNSAMPGMNVSITKPTVPAVKKPHQLYTIQQRIMKADVITRLLPTAVDNVEKVFMRMSAMELIFGNSYNQLLDIVRAGMDLKKELKPLSRKDRAYVQKGVHESVPYKSLTKNLQNFVDKSFA